MQQLAKKNKDIRNALKIINNARNYEDQKQFNKALDSYTLCIQRLLEIYKSNKISEEQIIITECVNCILHRSTSIRKQIEWQEELDKHKNQYLNNERLYTEYFSTKNETNNRLSIPLPLEITSNIPEDIYISLNSFNLPTWNKNEQINISYNNIYDDFYKESLKRNKTQNNEINVRPKLTPPELINMPIRPPAPISYTISRKSSYITSPLLIKRNSILSTTSIKMGKSHEEISEMIRYMLSTGIRTSVVKIMGNEVLNPFIVDSQLDHQKYYFFDKEEYQNNKNNKDNKDTYISLAYKGKYNFTFCDYSQFLFRDIRWKNNIDCDHYVHSISADPDGNSLENMISEGKSNANFFRSTNGEFVIKSLSEQEFEFFRQILLSYMEFVGNNPNTLLCRFYGLHVVQPLNEDPLYFVVMENIIPINPDIIRYDLKGSTYGREATEEEKRDGGILKDLDFKVPFIMSNIFQKLFFKQLEKDCNWLEKHMIMDYSFLVGVEHRSIFTFPSEISITKSPSIFKGDCGGFRSKDKNDSELETIYYTGIIDILQPYNIRKKVEHAFKSITESSTDISCVDPKSYSIRFQDFIKNHTAIAVSITDISITEDE